MDGIVMAYAGWADDFGARDSIDFDFEEVEGEVNSSDLVGEYEGWGGTVTAIYGIRGTRFENEVGVCFTPFFMMVGVDIGGPMMSLTLAVIDGD